MMTIVESPLISRLWPDYWSEAERGAFAAFLAANPQAGEVIPGSGGVRKIRWSRPGMGKRGGVRVIYFTRLAHGQIWLLTLYAKAVRENVPAHILRAMKEEIEND